jgi:hypothetical protein
MANRINRWFYNVSANNAVAIFRANVKLEELESLYKN